MCQFLISQHLYYPMPSAVGRGPVARGCSTLLTVGHEVYPKTLYEVVRVNRHLRVSLRVDE